MIKQNEQVITSDKNESYDHTHEIELRPLRDKNKKLFHQMVSDMVVTNLVNSKYISSEEFVDRKFEVINDMLQRAYGAGHNFFWNLLREKQKNRLGFCGIASMMNKFIKIWHIYVLYALCARTGKKVMLQSC